MQSFSVASICLLLAGCGSGELFNYGAEPYSPPISSSDVVTDLKLIQKDTASLAQRYASRASGVANSIQIFEVPAIGGAAGAVAGAIFRASQREIEAFAIGAASAISLDQYYAPRDRAQIYMNASSAMSCLSVLAGQAVRTITQYQENDTYALFISAKTGDVSTPVDQAQALQTLADLPTHSVIEINGATTQIGNAVVKQSLSKSNMPDFQYLQTKLTSQIQQSILKKAAAATATSPQQLMGFTSHGYKAQSLNLQQIKALTDFAADFDKQISLCTAMIGS